MKTWLVPAFGIAATAFAGSALAQNNRMMNGGMSGSGWMDGYGGPWTLMVLLIVAGLVVWAVKRNDK